MIKKKTSKLLNTKYSKFGREQMMKKKKKKSIQRRVCRIIIIIIVELYVCVCVHATEGREQQAGDDVQA